MLAASLIIVLGIWCTGTNSQYTLTQPAAQSFPLGQPAKISCVMSRDSQVGSYNIAWYQQKAGEGPKYLLYGTGSSGRFSGSKDTSANAAYLTVTNLQAEDEADYYCGSYYSSGGNWRIIFGGGTQLTVTGQPTVSPSVQLFAPSLEELRSPNPYTMVCVLTGFYPPGFNLQWKCDDKVMTSGVETTKATKQGVNYVASSYMKQSASAFERCGIFTCTVTHEGKTIEKSMSKAGSC